jgi:putative ABC transport system substrate-binding protein
MRLIGVLLPATADDVEFQVRIAAFHQGLQQSGWTIGRNVRIDTRWATTDAAEIRRHAAELAALAPDVILAHAATTVGPLLEATRTVPIVFPAVVDPVGAGFVDSLARPGGNATGFMNFEYSISGVAGGLFRRCDLFDWRHTRCLGRISGKPEIGDCSAPRSTS